MCEQTNLMATYENGEKWWVVGIIDDISNVKLPKWKAGEAPVQQTQPAITEALELLEKVNPDGPDSMHNLYNAITLLQQLQAGA